jgi:carboxyvinyl-carboxyphosphonate phosphorylmutase
MNVTERRERYRAVLAGDQCVYSATVFDPISARIAEDLGFEVGMVRGSQSAAAVLGAPDLPLVTLSELAQLIRRISRASALPLLVDADHGYGNALNVMRTVEELEVAGASAIMIEDTIQPIGFGTTGEHRLTSLEEGLGKMKAALAARQDPSLVIVYASRALEIADVSEAILRIKAYEKAGVDAIFLFGAETREAVEAIHTETKLPLVEGGFRRILRKGGDRQFLAANGVRIAAPGPLALHAAVKAMYDTLKALRDGKSPLDLDPALVSPELLAQVTRQSQYDDWAKNFLDYQGGAFTS